MSAMRERDRRENGGHDHGHGHAHSHASASRTRLAWALGVTAAILVAETVGAWVAGSLALAADAGHMLVDSSGLVIALIASHLMLKPRTDRHTWGWARAEVVATALQSGMLIVICGMVAWEGVTRLIEADEELAAWPMLIVGIVGLVANAVSLAILLGGREASLNMRAAFLEVVNDALGSIAVIVAAVVALTTGWDGADAVASLVIAVLMGPRAFFLLRSATRILMEQTPPELDLDLMREHMLGLDGVEDVHDLHVSTIQTGLVALTAHVATANLDASQRTRLLHELEECASTHFSPAIKHTTFQLDSTMHQKHEPLTH